MQLAKFMTKKSLLTLILIYLPIMLFGQKAEDALIGAELGFAKDCATHGIRNSFLMNVDSNAVAFEGIRVVRAKSQLMAQKESPGIIYWTPSYAEIADSKDWGYTTGNYEVRPGKMNDSIVGTGQYTTVWHKTEAGQWKYLIDLGVYHSLIPLASEPVIINAEKQRAEPAFTKSFLNQENTYLIQLKNAPGVAYREFHSDQFILNLNGHAPITSVHEAMRLTGNDHSAVVYEPKGFFTAPSNDMVAVYGVTTFKNKSNGYLRIWRNEKNGWKIALEVLRL